MRSDSKIIARKTRGLERRLAASALAFIHRRVGDALQGAGIGCIGREYGNSNTAIDPVRGIAHGDRNDKGLADVFRNGLGSGQPSFGKKNGELVAAEPSNRVRFPDEQPHPRRDFLKHLIPGGVSVRVVDRFKSVEVD
ncbi:MAG TPA: hypothetical protein VKT80_19780 [Chloroflexota bacterium]|nr:hypothetical protein [Chloroflexota bacterium]